MRQYLMCLLVLFSLSVLSGCVVGEWLTRDVDKEQVQKAKNEADTLVTVAQAQVALLKKQADEAAAVAKATGDANAAKAVEVLNRALAATQKGLDQARDVSAKAQVALDSMPAGGQRWQVGLALAWPFALPLLTKIPMVGPLIGLASPFIARAIATPAQAADTADVIARSAALTHQTAFAGDILDQATALAGKLGSQAEVDKALAAIQGIKDQHRHEQEAAGTADVIRAEVVKQAV